MKFKIKKLLIFRVTIKLPLVGTLAGTTFKCQLSGGAIRLRELEVSVSGGSSLFHK